MKNILKLCMLLMVGFVRSPTGTFESFKKIEVTFMSIEGEELGRKKVHPGTSPSLLCTEGCIKPDTYCPEQGVILLIEDQIVNGLEAVTMPPEDFTVTVVRRNKKELNQELHVTPCGKQHVLLWIPFLENPGTWGPYSLAVLVEKNSVQAQTFKDNLLYIDPINMIDGLITEGTKELLFFIPEGIAQFEILPNTNPNAPAEVTGYLRRRLSCLRDRCQLVRLESLTTKLIRRIFDSYERINEYDIQEFEFTRLYPNLAAFEAEVQKRLGPAE